MKTERLLDIIGGIDNKHLAEYDQEAVKMKATSIRWRKWGALAACFALILTASVVYWGNGSAALQVNQAELVRTESEIQTKSYGKITEEAWNKVMEEFQSVTGMEYLEFISRLPEDLTSGYRFYSQLMPTPENVDLSGEAEIHDFVIECRTKDGGKAKMFICKKERPLSGLTIQCDAPKTTKINGTDVAVYQDETVYLAQFSYLGAYYDVELEDFSQDSLETLLNALSKNQ